MRSEPGSEHRRDDEGEHDDQPADRHRAAQEPLAQERPAPGVRAGQREGVDDGAHARRPATLMRGLTSLCTASTARLTIAYLAEATTTTLWSSVYSRWLAYAIVSRPKPAIP